MALAVFQGMPPLFDSAPPPASRPGEIVRLDQPLVLPTLEGSIGLAEPMPGAGGLFEVGGVGGLAHLGLEGIPANGVGGTQSLFSEPAILGGLFSPVSDPLFTPSEPAGTLVSGGDWFFGAELSCSEPRWDGVPAMSIGTEALGLSALHFLGYRAGVGLMARNPAEASRYLRTEYGEANYRRIEFLFSDSAVSRARIQSLRDRIAERAGHHYTNLEDLRTTVRDVLREEGIDVEAWREARRDEYRARGDEYGSNMLANVHRDVMDGVLLIQLLPDELPLYRSTEPFRADQADPGGSSYWGVGADGMAVAASYMSPGRVFTTTTLGDLRRAGVVRSDEVAVTGNALELYHWNIEGSSDAFTLIPYTEVQPPVSRAR